MQKFIKFFKNWRDWSITIWSITIKIEQWLGPTMGISITRGLYSLGIFCELLKSYRIRNYPAGFQKSIWELIFSIKRNVRMAILVWHTDITILGFTFQFEKHKPEYMTK